MKLDGAEALAQKVRWELSPFCHRIEVAGSIRRRRPEVNDIDLVFIPSDMVGLMERVQHNCTLQSGHAGSQNIILNFGNGFQLDLWKAHDDLDDLFGMTPSNWGAVLLCRTGSMQHNIQLCARAKEFKLKFSPYKGLVAGDPSGFDKIVAGRTEEEIYEALGLKYLEPNEREELS